MLQRAKKVRSWILQKHEVPSKERKTEILSKVNKLLNILNVFTLRYSIVKEHFIFCVNLSIVWVSTNGSQNERENTKINGEIRNVEIEEIYKSNLLIRQPAYLTAVFHVYIYCSAMTVRSNLKAPLHTVRMPLSYSDG